MAVADQIVLSVALLPVHVSALNHLLIRKSWWPKIGTREDSSRIQLAMLDNIPTVLLTLLNLPFPYSLSLPSRLTRPHGNPELLRHDPRKQFASRSSH
jgi:hypothetical protein